MRYKNVSTTYFRFLTNHAFDTHTDRQTVGQRDGQTERQTDRWTAFSCMQRGKNAVKLQ